MKCSEDGCPLVAGYALKISVPAKEDIRELEMTFAIGLCYRHIKQVRLEHLLTDDAKKLFELGWRNAQGTKGEKIEGKVPDFSRAVLKPIYITSKELQIIKDANEARARIESKPA